MPQRKSKLMRKHTNLPAMVRLMSNHVAKHLHANRPRLSPAISPKHLNPTLERLSQHLPTSSRTLRQSNPRLRLRTVRTVQQRRNLQVRSRKPHPLATNIVHMRKDRRDSPNLTRRFRNPRTRVKMLDKTLVHTIISSKHPNRSPIKLSVNLISTSSHGSAPRPIVVPAYARNRPEIPTNKPPDTLLDELGHPSKPLTPQL
jgi:hypothetical protein